MTTTEAVEIEGFRSYLTQGWPANEGRPDAQFILAWLRLAQWALVRWDHVGGRAIVASWKLGSRLIGLEVPAEVEIGPRLALWHFFGIVFHPTSKLGADCQIRQGVTLGNRGGSESAAPDIGSGVDIGAYAAVLGGITVGDGAKIGAHAVVIQPVPAGAVAVGNPARIL